MKRLLERLGLRRVPRDAFGRPADETTTDPAARGQIVGTDDGGLEALDPDGVYVKPAGRRDRDPDVDHWGKPWDQE